MGRGLGMGRQPGLGRRLGSILLALCAVGAGAVALAASPHLADIDPAGVQCGVDTDVLFSGDHLQDARGLLIYEPGISVLSVQAVDNGKVRIRLHVAADSPLGEHELRLWTASGITELMPMYVGQFPNVISSGSNRSVARAQAVPVNTTVSGVIQNEQIDYYSIQAKQGDRISAEVEGMRLGRDMFDPWAAILDAKGKQLAANDDNSLLLEDPLVSMIAPVDGTYLVSVRESTWGGSPKSRYRLHIGNFPQPMVVFPSGGQAGQTLGATFLGDVKGAIPINLKMPPAPVPGYSVSVSDHGIFAPQPLPIRVSTFPNVIEKEPNGDAGHATAGPPPPVAFNGILKREREMDYFKFHAKTGVPLDITVYGRQLRSPIDSVLDVWDATGKHLANNDDSIGPDSYLRFSPKTEGDYCISVRDQLYRSGANFVYRVEVVPVTPSINFTLPEIVRNSQERQAIVIPRGNRYATMLRMKRESVDGPVVLDMPELPRGITVTTGTAAGDLMPVIFEAAPDAPVNAALTDVRGRASAGDIAGGYSQTVELVHGPPNDYPYLKSDIAELAVSVAQEAPIHVEVTPPAAPVLQDGQSTLKVLVNRAPGFTGPVNVSMLYNPPGLSTQAVVTIPAGQSSIDLPLNAGKDAKPKMWQVGVIASADAGQGMVWVASSLVPLQIAAPYLTATLDRSSTVQGAPVDITCHLQQRAPFSGRATLKLMGLPSKVTAPDVAVSSTDSQVVFHVATDVTCTAGPHKDLYCQVTLQQNGVQLVANTADGGVLRIDPAIKKEVAAK